MRLADLHAVEHRGELIAVVSCERIHIVAPRLLALPVGDPELRHAVYMATLCSMQLAAGLPIDGTQAARWADGELEHDNQIAVAESEGQR